MPASFTLRRSGPARIRVQALSYQSDLVYVYLVLDEEISFPTYLGCGFRGIAITDFGMVIADFAIAIGGFVDR